MAGIAVETRGTIATLTIENVGKRNSLTAKMWHRLPEVLSELASDPSVKVLVVRGAGEDFSSGADIRDLARILHAPGMPDGGLVTVAENALAEFPKPTVAAIDGFCVGEAGRSRPPVTSASRPTARHSASRPRASASSTHCPEFSAW